MSTLAVSLLLLVGGSAGQVEDLWRNQEGLIRDSVFCGPMPQTCYAPRYGCYPGNERHMHRYPAFHGYYYRRPYNYRHLFEYPWHAEMHEPTSLFAYNTEPGDDDTLVSDVDLPPGAETPDSAPSDPAEAVPLPPPPDELDSSATGAPGTRAAAPRQGTTRNRGRKTTAARSTKITAAGRLGGLPARQAAPLSRR
ncbi:MAG: hypothetical protein K1X71_02545 [Pirellulales bacterium]|nr:hypothetical protein [Pirellulales bacterium]